MFTSPRVIAIDDEEPHLSGLARSLNSHGIACLQIHFTKEQIAIHACPDVRVIFADLHLGGGVLGTDPTTDFGVIGNLLEDSIKPAGPYCIVLWTMYPTHATALLKFLEQRVEGVTKPFAVVPLAKADYLDGHGNVISEDALLARITEISTTLPPIGALFDWEKRVLEATGQTVSSILNLSLKQETDARVQAVGRVLGRLAIASVGRGHVDTHRFRAVNEALLPILADRIANLPLAEAENQSWQAAFAATDGEEGLTLDEAAKLNRLVHIADCGDAGTSERGIVICLPEEWRTHFETMFGIDEALAATTQFRCKNFVPGEGHIRWILVQCQAACDYAQSRPGPRPWHLGLEMPRGNVASSTPPAAVWQSPALHIDGQVRHLHVSASFLLAFVPGVVRDAVPIYRLRDQMLNELISHIHRHGASVLSRKYASEYAPPCR